MSRIAQLALVAACSVVLQAALLTAVSAAPVSVVNQFSTTPCATATTATTLTCTNPTVGAGSNRLLVLVVTGEGTGNHNPANTTATYGGATFTQVQVSDGNNDNRRYVWMGYIDESQLTANAGSNIVASNTSSVGWAGTEAYYAVYDNVDQGAPVSGSTFADSPNTTATVTMGPITTLVDGAAIYAIAANATTGDTSIPAGYSEHVDQADASNNYFSTIGSRLGLAGTSESVSATAVNARWTAAYMALTPLSCTDTNGSAVTLTDPTNGATVSGSFAITTSLNNASNVEYSIDGGAWTPIATLWNTANTHPASNTAPVSGVTVEVRAIEDECGGYVTDSVTVTVDNTCTESTQSSIIWNGTDTAAGDFSGSSFVSPTDIVPGSLEYQVTETAAGAGVVTRIGTWSTGSYNTLPTTYAVPADGNGVSDRLLMVAVSAEDAGLVDITGVTYGGQSLTLVAQATQGAGYSNNTWVGYCNESCIAAAGSTAINVAFNGAYIDVVVFAATYEGVDQASPITDFDFAASAGEPIAATVTAADGDQVFYAVEFNGSETNVPSTGFTESALYDTAGTGFTFAINDRTTTAAGTVNISAASGGGSSNRTTIVAVALNAGSSVVETTVIPWTTDPISASGTLTDGNSYNLYARGLDPECGVAYYGDSVAQVVSPGTSQAFTWSACTETATLTLQPIADPITGNVTVIATGTATGITVGTTPAAGNPSGWVYTPAQDDNTTTVSFYAVGTGVCGTLTASQLNVATDTMAAPVVTAFSIPANVVDTAAPLVVPVTTFTATDNVAVTGYLITEGATAPGAGDAGWQGTAPTTYTVAGYGGYTLYAWASDAAGNVSLSASAPVTVSDCTETGTVSLDALPDPLTGNVNVTATASGGASNPEVSFDGGATWLPNGSLYSPPPRYAGTVDMQARALGACAGYVYSPVVTVNIDTRADTLYPLDALATQNGLSSIRVTMIYCDDKNGNATYTVRYKLASAPDIPANWTSLGPVTDGGAGDVDGTRDEAVIILLPGLTQDETYDVEMTFADADGYTPGGGATTWNQQVGLVSWVDDPMLHNALRFACDKPGYADQTSCEANGGTWNLNRKWTGGWGTTSGEYGPIMCTTCHARNTGNAKRIAGAVTASSGSFPGSAVNLQDVADGTAEFGDDSGGHATSDRICEVCHTQTDYHRYDTAGQAVTNHYNQADCIKCHEHKSGFRAGCTACHGNPPLAAGELTGVLDPANTTNSGTWGAHQRHAAEIGFECITCHTGWTGNGQMPNGGNLNIGFDLPFGAPAIDGGSYEGRPSAGGSYTADAGTGTTVTQDTAATDMTCAVYCHGYGRPEWNPAATANCGACHGQTTGAYADNRDAAPDGDAGNGGRDLAGATTGTRVGKHANHLDNSLAETGDACALCHPGGEAHVGGMIDGTVQVTLDTAAGPSAAFTAGSPGTCSNMTCHGDADWDSAAAGGCTLCHGYPPSDAAGHASGVTAVNHTAALLAAHDDCTYCHGFKNNGSGAEQLLTPAEVTALRGSWTPALSHHDGSATITINDNGNASATDDANYNPANGGCDNSACHANDAGHRMPVGGGTGNSLLNADIGPGACSTCHDSGVGGAPVVTSASTHVRADGATYGDCTDCHSGHANGTPGAGEVDIPTTYGGGTAVPTMTDASGTALYGSHENQIRLGGTIASGASEAQICWGCHDSVGVSEWGVNDNADTRGNAGTAITYNYGTLSTSNWTTATWYSGKGAAAGGAGNPFWYKRGAIQSTHSVNFDTGTAAVTNGNGAGYNRTEAPDAVGAIRCSYCHDVHGTHDGIDGDVAGAATGPFLRGTWKGNPYPEDGAPQWGMANWTVDATTSVTFGRVPRGSAAANNSGLSGVAAAGGFWIDQNSGNPNSSETADSTAGLCEVCHAGGNGSWTTAELGAIDYTTAGNEAGNALWVSGYNGHANVVIGGGGRGANGSAESYARNIFTRAKRGSNQAVIGRTRTGLVDMGLATEYDRGYSYRGNEGSGLDWAPHIATTSATATGTQEPYSFRYFVWNENYNSTRTRNGSHIAAGTLALQVADQNSQFTTTGTKTEAANYDAQANYHTFNCGKCHNPHASRLPKLMITNCLDTNHNTWDNNYAAANNTAAGTNFNGTRVSQWAAAQNCHRLDDRAPLASGQSTVRGLGWNEVTPWQEYTNPNTNPTANPNP